LQCVILAQLMTGLGHQLPLGAGAQYFRYDPISGPARYRLLAIYPFGFFAREGGLMAYGPDQIDQWRGAARYTDRILKGEKPGELPVQTPTKFEFVINMKTAKKIGLTITSALPLRADEVIE
jgi:putative tryptophan/tyrosine transport system substrate-binding protein